MIHYLDLLMYYKAGKSPVLPGLVRVTRTPAVHIYTSNPYVNMFFVFSAYATLDLVLSVLPLQRNPASAGRRGTRPLITCESVFLSFWILL